MVLFSTTLPRYGSLTFGTALFAFFVLAQPNSFFRNSRYRKIFLFFSFFILSGLIADYLNFFLNPERSFEWQIFFTSILRLWTYFSTLVFFLEIFARFKIIEILVSWFLAFSSLSFLELILVKDFSFDLDPMENLWKFALFLPSTSLIFHFTKTKKFLFVVIATILILISAKFDFQSAVIVLILTTLTFILEIDKNRGKRSIKIVFLFITCTLAIIIFRKLDFSLNNIFGENKYYRKGLNGSPLTVILEDRKESFGGLLSFKNNPLGWGLGHKMSYSDLQIALEPYKLYSTRSIYKGLVFQNYLNGKIYFHSMIWDAWARYFVAPFILILFFLKNCIIQVLSGSHRDPLVYFFIIQLTFDLFFSTIGTFNDLLMIAYLISRNVQNKTND